MNPTSSRTCTNTQTKTRQETLHAPTYQTPDVPDVIQTRKSNCLSAKQAVTPNRTQMSNATRPDAIKRLAIKTKAASFDEWQAAAAAVASLGLEEFDEPRSIVSVPFSPTTLKHQNHRKATRLSLRDKLGMPRAFGEEMEAKLGKAIKEFHERQVKIGSGTEHYLKGSKGRRPTWSESDGFNLPCKEIDELINLSKHSSKWENDPQRCWWRSPSHARASSGSCLGRQQSFTGLVTTSRKSRSSSRIIKRRHSFNGFPTTSELVNRSMLPDLREFFDHQYRIALLRIPFY